MSMFSYDICFCSEPKCADPSKCRRDPSRLKNYKYPVAMSDFNEFDADGNCMYFFPIDEKPIKKEDEADALLIQFLLGRKK